MNKVKCVNSTAVIMVKLHRISPTSVLQKHELGVADSCTICLQKSTWNKYKIAAAQDSKIVAVTQKCERF